MKFLWGTFVMKYKEGFTFPENRRSNEKLTKFWQEIRLSASIGIDSLKSLLYTNSMFPEYGDTGSHSYAPSIVQQTSPRADPNPVVLQELLAAQKREFDEIK
ncbi:hypothetical protein LIER_36039 [Lithospermum erythrorhizon]|uniref:Uncharacterized protein n=1 Tax=Lithospermum erythrorhizon TaxID=34254 RepID=A0AAV3P2M2_LITER